MTHKHREEGDLISLLVLSQNEESRLKREKETARMGLTLN
jgi:hypothetical protein